MAKTELTKEIEKALKAYAPVEIGGIKINKFRDSHIAFEVPVECGTTKSGLVDAVQISEYFSKGETIGTCAFLSPVRRKFISDNPDKDFPINGCPEGHTYFSIPENCNNVYPCRHIRRSEAGIPQILIICFEIKISKSDFKSKNGHNFVGNLNYYVVPKDLYPQIADLVPENVGVLVYYDGKGEPKKNNGWTVYPYQGLRKKKDSSFKELSESDQKWMVLSVLKRIRQGA